jgi:hypothetical protein
VSDSMLLSTVKRKDPVEPRISFTFFPPQQFDFNACINHYRMSQADPGQSIERLKLEAYDFAGLLTKNHGY